MRLDSKNLVQMPPNIRRPEYNRAQQKVGIVHFGIGAFHRAHQAWYTDAAMAAGDRDWMIAGVSLRSATVAGQLNPQEGLYTLTERSASGDETRLIGSVRNVFHAQYDIRNIFAQIAKPETHVVSFTVTEKGYCRKGDGSLDLGLAEDSFYLPLAIAMQRRKEKGRPGFTLLSCDNLADNGHQLQRLMGEFLDSTYPDLRAWFDAECSCPATMIDRIVPATTPAALDAVAAAIGLRDEAAVLTEPFSQWVIEDRFAGPRPSWERHGAELVTDVAPYETAKLRMLNGAHSALAYCGLQAGYAYVHEAVADPALRALVERLMRQEAAPTIAVAPGQDLAAYADALIERFANPALQHRLIQIAMDGSQKVPQRWLETLAAGAECPSILTAIAAWLGHLRGDNGAVDDPRAAELAQAWQQVGRNGIVAALFGPGGLMASDWVPSAVEIATITQRL